MRSNAAVASWGSEECEIFAIHDDGQLRDRYWDGASWHEWESLGGSFVGDPAAAANGADRIDVFAVGGDGRVRHRWWNGREWVPWEVVEGAPPADAVSCVWTGDRLDLFVTKRGRGVWYRALRAS